MSIFMIETSNLDSASSSIGKIASQMSDLASSVGGYDTSCDDGFDFASVKGLIESNIEACITKVQNTATILNTVSQSHTELQSSLKFEDPAETTKKSSSSEGTNSENSNSRGNTSSGGYTENSSASGGYSGGGSSDGGSYSGGYSSSAVPTAAAALQKVSTTKETKQDEVVEITNSFKEVGYVYIDKDKINDDAKKVFENEEFEYEENGYAKIGNRYVVMVDSSIAKEGDVLRFTQEDGTEIEAIVGLTTTDNKYADKINFVLSPDKEFTEETKKISESILKNNKKIEIIENILKSSITGENSVLIESTMDEVGNTISDYSGLGFNDGNWCADFVSHTLQKNGYDVDWSSVAGDGDGEIFGCLRDSGATVHLDLGAQAKGLQESSEYDPSYIPQPGDVVIFDFEQDGLNDHVGFVVKDNGDGTITTLEGNTSGEAGGSCVAIHTDRQRSIVYGYATPVKK